jgi:4-aminobutyrate aminotransferase / (S)-3-amino-2-methylpropionate transaminase / 5-aminovalerate transaminase
MIKKITEIPGPLSQALMERRHKAVPRGPYNTAPIFIHNARGAILEDVDGNTYIDFAGGLGCLIVGNTAPEVVTAIKDQADDYLHTCFHVTMNEPYVALAERLNRLVPGNFEKKTFFVNSGAEAVENAVKIARSYTGRRAVIAFEDAFHGRTLLALSLTSKVAPYKLGFGPFAPEVYRLPYAYCYRCPYSACQCAPLTGDQAITSDTDALKLPCVGAIDEFFQRHVAPSEVAAIIVEPVLGEGGFVVPPGGFLKGLERICRKHGIVLIVDEVQTGMGRTGAIFASERYGIEPDILITAKSLAGGLPLGSITGRAEIMDHPIAGGLGGTFGGNPLACRAALAAIDIIEKQNLCERALDIGHRLIERFRRLYDEIELIGDVRGLGAMCAIELVKDRSTKEPAKAETEEFKKLACERGLITITAGTFGNCIRVLAPLVISDEELELGLDIMEESLKTVAGGR